jgi:uncharacterized protein (DUF58 family)
VTAHLTRVKARMSLHAHRKVRGLLEGEYASLQTGRSMDFADLREYVRGDDVKDLDWKASARSGTLLVKRYAAARKHSVLLAVSTGRSMAAMNDVDVAKRDLAVMVAGVVGYLATRHGDLVAGVYGDSAGQRYLKPSGSELGLERILAGMHDATRPDAAAADLEAVLGFVARTVRRRTILVVVADEYAVSPGLASVLRRLAVQHEVLFVSIGDLDPTAAGSRPLVDVDSGRAVPAWAQDDPMLRREFGALLAADTAGMRRRLDGLGIVHERVHDDASAIAAIFSLLERHRHARRR